MQARSVLMAATAGIAGASGDASTATQAADQAGRLSAQAMAVSFHYTGGKYDEARFEGVKAAVTPSAPKATGEYSVIKTPVPVLFASGSPQVPTVLAFFSALKAAEFGRIRADKPSAKPDKYKAKVITLQFPRLVRTQGDSYFTRVEMLSTSQDIGELFPSLKPQHLDLTAAEADYRAGLLEFHPDNCKLGLAGYDAAGNVYSARLSPDCWLVSVAVLPELNSSSGGKHNAGIRK